MNSNIIDTVIAALTSITVALSTWAAFSARSSAKAAQSQYQLSRDDSLLSRQPIILPIEFDYQTYNSEANFTLDGKNYLDKKFGDLEILATNVSNANAFNVISYLYVKNTKEYLEFLSANKELKPWMGTYALDFNEATDSNKKTFLQLIVRNYENDSLNKCINFSQYDVVHRTNPKMKLGLNESIQVTVNSYAQVILRDYINRRLFSIFQDNRQLEDHPAFVDPEIEVIFRYKTVDQLKTNEYTNSRYKVVFEQIRNFDIDRINFRLMYIFKK